MVLSRQSVLLLVRPLAAEKLIAALDGVASAG
jgi:hypothetical protein